jgi:hypothetical protein
VVEKHANWDRLSTEDKQSILNYANLGSGVVINIADYGTLKFGKPLLKVGIDSFAKPVYPEGGGYDCTVYETRTEFHQRDFGLTETKANVGLSGTFDGVTGGGSGSSSSSTQTETTTDSTKTTYYLYAEYLVNMVQLDLKPDTPSLDASFQLELTKAVNASGAGIQKIASVYAVLNKFGWYVPSSITLGGKLVQTETVTTDKETETSKIANEFSDDFKANVGVPGEFSADGGGSSHTKTEQDTSSTNYQSVSGKHRRFVGGSQSALSQDGLQTWLDSLDDALQWRVVGMKLFPVLAYMPVDLMNQIRKMQNDYGSREEARKLADTNAFQYFAEVQAAQSNSVDW